MTTYITYLRNPARRTNAAASHAGIGRTPVESQANATYWANQKPYVRTVGQSKAPAWAVDEAINALRIGCSACGGPRHRGVCVDRDGDVLPEYAERARAWQVQGCPAQYADGEIA